MAVGANSYGTVADVAALTWAWVAEEQSKTYTTITLPTLAQVEGWIDQTSAVMNTSLSKNGFTIPVTQADAILAIKSVVIGYVADMANYANSTGRFFTERALASSASPFDIIRKEIDSWVESFAPGLEQWVRRVQPPTSDRWHTASLMRRAKL